MLELEGSDESEAEADVACRRSQIIISAGEQDAAGAIKLKRPLPGFMQMKILQYHITSHAKACPARHTSGQARQVGPDILIELANNKIPPIATGPFGRLLLEDRAALTTPRTQEWLLSADPKRRFEEVRVKHIVIIHEDQQLSRRLAGAAQTGGRETKRFLSNNARRRMPGKVDAIRDRFVTSIIDHNQFPPVGRECLVP
jgi:hypothetical protein